MSKLDLSGYLRQSGGNRRASLAVSKLVLQFAFDPAISSAATGIVLPKGAIPLSVQNISGGGVGGTIHIGVIDNINGFASNLSANLSSGEVVDGSLIGVELAENTEIFAGAGDSAPSGGSVFAVITYIMADDGQPDKSTPIGTDSNTISRIEDLEDDAKEFLTSDIISQAINARRPQANRNTLDISALESIDEEFNKMLVEINEKININNLKISANDSTVNQETAIAFNSIRSSITTLANNVNKSNLERTKLENSISTSNHAIEEILNSMENSSSDSGPSANDLFLIREDIDFIQQKLGIFVDPDEEE